MAQHSASLPKKQATVAFSSLEAEYHGMAAAVQEALHQICIKLCQNATHAQVEQIN